MKKIEFIASDEDTALFVDSPIPSSKVMPKWFLDAFPYFDNNEGTRNVVFKKTESRPNKTIKHCVPVLDSISFGYIQLTWTDIWINQDLQDLEYKYSSGPEIVSSREQIVKQKMQPPIGCSDIMLDWKIRWVPKTPKGYSCLICHPMYRDDLPFVVLPGIIDSDSFFNGPGNGPSFFVKKDFNGLIPKGTPMYQIIPFKKESWRSENQIIKYKKDMEKQSYEINSRFQGGYKKLFWNKVKFL